MQGQPISAPKSIVIAAVVMCMSLLMPYLVRPVQHISASGPDSKYFVIFDGGSSGSRVHVYRFNLTSAGEYDFDTETLFITTKPGLSSYNTNPRASAESLLPLLRAAEAAIPHAQWGCTPIVLYATAGLRLLGDHTSNRILHEIRQLFSDSNFTLLDPNHVAVLDGAREGVFGWMTTNYLLGLWPRGPIDQTVALVDLGGASTQIVFRPRGSAPRPPIVDGATHPHATAHHAHTDPHVHHADEILEAAGSDFHYHVPISHPLHTHIHNPATDATPPTPRGGARALVYQHSHLGFGLHEAERQVRALGRRGWVAHAAAHLRATAAEGGKEGHQQRHDHEHHHHGHGGYDMFEAMRGVIEGGEGGGGVGSDSDVGGDGVPCNSFDECRLAAHAILRPHDVECSHAAGCALRGKFMPRLREFFPGGKVFAISYVEERLEPWLEVPHEHKDVIDSTHVGEELPHISLRRIREVASEIVCPNDPSLYMSDVKGGNRQHCFDLAYIYGLLHDGYMLDDDTDIVVAKKIHGVETAWCLGAALDVSQLADEKLQCNV